MNRAIGRSENDFESLERREALGNRISFLLYVLGYALIIIGLLIIVLTFVFSS